MARKKVNLQWIANDSTRRATFKKRRRGLMKKASELATLCDVKACVVVYGPGDTQPEVWPSLPEAGRVLARFKSMPELEQCKKMMNQEGFLQQRVAKLQEQLRKQERDNRELETTLLMHESMTGRRPGLAGVSIEEVTSLGWMVEMRLKAVHDRIEHLRSQASAAPPLPTAAASTMVPFALQPPMAPFANVGVKVQPPGAPAEGSHRQSWLMEVLNASDVGGSSSGGAMFYNGFGYGGGGAEEMMHLCTETGFPWPDPSFPPM